MATESFERIVSSDEFADIGAWDSLLPEDSLIRTQICNLSVFATTEVVRTDRLDARGSGLIVNGPPGEVAISVEGSALHLFLAEHTLTVIQTSMQWFDALTQYCKIHDPTSRHLLFATLTDLDHNRVCELFSSHSCKFNYTPTANGE